MLRLLKIVALEQILDWHINSKTSHVILAKVMNTTCFVLMLIFMVKFILISVHGFQRAFYTVIEGDNITIQFTKAVKGRSQFPSPNLRGRDSINWHCW